MTRRKFDRYMVVSGAGNHVKFARLSEAERCAHFLGVLSIAAQSPIRGCLLVGDQEAEAVEIAYEARVSERVAKATLVKLKAIGVLERDDDLGCWRVHDWDDINPAPKDDATAAERAKRYRDKRKARHAIVTAPSRRDDRDGHAPVTAVSREEVEVEVEEQQSPSDSCEIADIDPPIRDLETQGIFDAWVTATKRDLARTKLTTDRRRVIATALKSHGFDDCLLAVTNIGRDAWAMGANERGRPFSGVEHALRGAERIERWRDWQPNLSVVPNDRRSAKDIRQDDRRQAGERLLAQLQEDNAA